MSNVLKTLVALGFVAVLSACAGQQEEEVVFEPVTTEPEFTGKM